MFRQNTPIEDQRFRPDTGYIITLVIFLAVAIFAVLYAPHLGEMSDHDGEVREKQE